MKRLVLAAALFGAVIYPAHAGQMFAACTLHQGIVVCFDVPRREASSGGGPCYDAQKNLVAAQDYASRNGDKAEAIAKIMSFATDRLFEECGWPVAQPVAVPVPASTPHPAPATFRIPAG